jgi:pimeloyl-ACP methyl ester carboxylesterase
MIGERIVDADGVRLCVETIGAPSDPALLLIAGTGASMTSWDDSFCRRLVKGRRFVIRYDHRDTGRSATYECGDPPYSLRDLATDALGVLDALGVPEAHVVGVSMGGFLGQLLALDRPDRVTTLSLLSSSPGGSSHEKPDLPAMPLKIQIELNDLDLPDWSDRESAIGYLVAAQRCTASRTRLFDEQAGRTAADRAYDRSIDLMTTMTNHFLIDEGDPWRERLGELTVPTLVVHGTEDPVFPFAHALALAQEIPDAELVPLDGAGHEVAPADWDTVVLALLRHTALDRAR